MNNKETTPNKFSIIEILKSIFSKRSAKYGIHMLIMIIVVLGIVVLIGAITANHHLRYDLTSAKRHSLSDETIKVLKSVDKDVKATAFYQENSGSQTELEILFKQYRYRNSKFSYKFIDPDRNPTIARKYDISDYGTTIFESGLNETSVSWAREEKITNAILKVIRTEKKTIYFLKGHGESDIQKVTKEGYSHARKALEGQNYNVKELVLLQSKNIPQDASVVIISGPKMDMLKKEFNLVRKYISKGGNILFQIDPFTVPRLVSFLKEYNIFMRNDIIIDKMSQLYGGDYLMPVVIKYEPHKITRNFNVTTFFPFSRSIYINKKAKGPATVESLANTNESSWGETNRRMVDKGEAVFNANKDIKGPLTIAVTATLNADVKEPQKGKTQKCRILAFGDSDFANNTYLDVLGNRDLFLNAVNWLAEEEDLISIRPKDTDYNPVTLSKTMGKVIFYIPVILIPALILLLGIGVLSYRRWKK
ncbi:MAG: GldG family protein [Spirochaetota bacterium]|nr:GldG family protein [Spirochaetota bacterium]